ncbi:MULTISPECIES: TlpA family protein disulfide reductase [Streptomyces]|uniref:TlpA family protein disulfide reductase n=1 Tax=Streptomyces flavovirens TaxID=52258 RepID=A0ABV8N934_9ACTN|nr:TlpA disulfide reductase family protein [Streptomyces sp. MBT51]MBK3594660.1 TlpA family protein disulfide reductase [Streptomyces sp. MBT51]
MPSDRPRLHRPAALTGLVAAGALLLSACAGEDGGTADTGTEFVTTGGGVSTVARGHRADAPKLDGTTLDGKRLDVADFRGEVVVLNVWASTCGPCRLEAEHFAKVSEELRDRGVRFVGINTRDVQKAPAVSFERDYGVTYPSLHDPAGRLLLRFPKGTLNPQTIPSTVVIDREGKVAARALAALDEAGLREMIAPLTTEK